MGKVRCVESRLFRVGLGEVRQVWCGAGSSGFVLVRSVGARPGKAGKVGLGKSRFGKLRHGKASSGKAGAVG